MNAKQLITFLRGAHKATYAGSGEKLKKPHRPGCEEYLYEKGDWKYLDSYPWGNNGGGEEIVYFKGKPVWVMNYFGFLVDGADSKLVYPFLKKALRQRHSELPVRGAFTTEGDLRYEVFFDRADIENFHGVERIYQGRKLAYECYLHGGAVN